VARIVTPGTLTDSGLLGRDARHADSGSRQENLITRPGGESAWPGSISPPGVSRSPRSTRPALPALLARIRPAEILAPDDFALAGAACAVRRLAPWQFDTAGAQTRLAQQLGSRDLAGFGVADLHLAIAAAGALLDYIQTTQRTALPHIQSIRAERDGDFVQLDAATRRNLELTETLRGEAAPTLLSVLDTTATGMGTRLLRHWLHHPLRDRDVLTRSGAMPSACWAKARHRHHAHPAAEKLRRRRAHQRPHRAAPGARPRDLSGLRDTLALLPELAPPPCPTGARLAALQTALAPGPICTRCWRAVSPNLRACCATAASLPTASTPTSTNCARMTRDAGAFLLELEARERARSGIATLKVEYNKVHGFYIEVSRARPTRCPTTTAAARR
jgi:DNA mismatch repair protein MutS